MLGDPVMKIMTLPQHCHRPGTCSRSCAGLEMRQCFRMRKHKTKRLSRKQIVVPPNPLFSSFHRCDCLQGVFGVLAAAVVFGNVWMPQIQFRIHWFRVISSAQPQNFDVPLTATILATLPYTASEMELEAPSSDSISIWSLQIAHARAFTKPQMRTKLLGRNASFSAGLSVQTWSEVLQPNEPFVNA